MNLEDEYHPAVFLYGSLTAEDAAKWWYERAMESATEINDLKDQLHYYENNRIHKLVQRFLKE